MWGHFWGILETRFYMRARAGLAEALWELGVKQQLLEQTLDELDSALDWMVLLGRKTAEERVATLLLMLATRASLHSDRQETTRQLSMLKRRGLIELTGRRQVTVPDVGALAGAAG